MEKEWMLATEAFNAFRDKHPELALTGGHWGFHNMLRQNKARLEKADAIRKANGKHWIAHVDRFHRALFDLLTLSHGKQSIAIDEIADMPVNQTEVDEQMTHEIGMTLRDYFAAKVVQALWQDKDWGEDLVDQAARIAYMQADAMLKARKEQ